MKTNTINDSKEKHVQQNNHVFMQIYFSMEEYDFREKKSVHEIPYFMRFIFCVKSHILYENCLCLMKKQTCHDKYYSS